MRSWRVCVTLFLICSAGIRLVRSYAPQRAPVEVIKMRMRHEYEVNGRQMMNFEARLFQSFDDT